jgi:acetyl-CoA carboxylase carboxyl transferase subunit beta
MAWFKKERKPRTSERVRLEIPADAWEKCDQCGHVDIRERFVRALNVCPNCGYHRRISAQEYIDFLVDEGSWHEVFASLKSADPLKFENYADRVQAAVKKAGPLDAIRTGYARLHGMSVSLGVMDFAFMGGSMGSVVGEKFSRACDSAVERNVPLVSVSASGGARMQEGILALMQLPKTVAAVEDLRDARVGLISVLAHPTTGGLLASFASLGDVLIAEPGALMSFAGPRVVQQTTREKLPDDFGLSESNYRFGHIDAVVPRPELRATVSRLVRLFSDAG